MANMGTLVVHDWYTSCGACNYGAGGIDWRGKLEHGPLSPSSRVCPSCGVVFVEIFWTDMYKIGKEDFIEELQHG